MATGLARTRRAHRHAHELAEAAEDAALHDAEAVDLEQVLEQFVRAVLDVLEPPEKGGGLEG